jgi:protein involved in polysaccharide export with SLBB domain
MNFIRLDNLHYFRLTRIRLGIDYMNAGGAKTRDDQVAAFHMGMRGVRAQRGAACVPAEVMQLVSGVRHVDPAYDLAVGLRLRIYVQNHQSVRPSPAVCV